MSTIFNAGLVVEKTGLWTAAGVAGACLLTNPIGIAGAAALSAANYFFYALGEELLEYTGVIDPYRINQLKNGKSTLEAKANPSPRIELLTKNLLALGTTLATAAVSTYIAPITFTAALILNLQTAAVATAIAVAVIAAFAVIFFICSAIGADRIVDHVIEHAPPVVFAVGDVFSDMAKIFLNTVVTAIQG